jgi:hypothetical protein
LESADPPRSRRGHATRFRGRRAGLRLPAAFLSRLGLGTCEGKSASKVSVSGSLGARLEEDSRNEVS